MMPDRSLLLTDLYQLTMLQAYVHFDMHDEAVFEFFVRRMPRERAFLVAAGLEQSLECLEDSRFTEEELEWLRNTGRFQDSLLTYLEGFRFTGDVHAVAEGTLFFPDEPILRVTAPLPQGQLLETRLINILHFQTLIASKAVRAVLAAPGKLLVDFGFRRSHGDEAGVLAARAEYLVGFGGSATVEAGRLFGIPLYGTMAHSFIQAHDSETRAFEHFAEACPNNVVLLVDTYDTETGAEKVVNLAHRLRRRGIEVTGVRLDSGDLGEHARRVREILDKGGLEQVRIMASGGLDEYKLSELAAAGAPIDGFGVGTNINTSDDAPSLDCAYKLQEYGGVARRKRSEGKATWPGRKQIFRQYGDNGIMDHDVLALEDERMPGEPLVRPVMKEGRRLRPTESLAEARERTRDNLERLPARLKHTLKDAEPYNVIVSERIRELARQVDKRAASEVADTDLPG